MTDPLPPLARRHLVGLIAGPLLLGRGRTARAAAAPPTATPRTAAPPSNAPPATAPPTTAMIPAVPFPEGATILVAGPDGGRLGRWGEAIETALGAGLPPGTKVQTTCSGGVDGVTGANQFEARVQPDGGTVLLVPGAAALDWLVGDPRAHFDVAHWVPIMAGVTPGIIMARPAATRPGADRIVRVAASGPVGPQLPALLGLDLLGMRVAPVFGLVEPEAAHAAFVADKADAVLVCGQNAPQQVAALRQAGGEALVVLGAVDASGTPGRDPAFPEVPTLAELYTERHRTKPFGARYDAWRAAAAAAQLAFGLVLPRLTSAALVALWRAAASHAIEQPEVRALADSFAVRPLEGVAAAAAMTGIAVDPAALLELRGWLATRFNWRPT